MVYVTTAGIGLMDTKKTFSNKKMSCECGNESSVLIYETQTELCWSCPEEETPR